MGFQNIFVLSGNMLNSFISEQKTKNETLFQIEPFASLVNTVRSTVPRLLLNRHAVGPFEKVPLRRRDHLELGDLEDTVRRFAEMLGWNNEIKELMMSQERVVRSILSTRPLKIKITKKKSSCRPSKPVSMGFL